CQSCRARIPEEKVENTLHPFSVEAFLDSGEFTDFVFVVCFKGDPDVPERKFRAHKLFLAMRNEVFYAMFYGNLAENDQVVITDINPDGFHILLRYLYSGRPRLTTISDALHARIASRKYLVPQLADACSAYIEKNLKADQLCSFIDYYMRSCEPDMDSVVQTLLTSNSLGVLTSKGFNSALEDTVLYIVDNIKKVSEASVSNAVFGWAQEQCVRSLGLDTQLELKTVMRPFFPKLRFLTMTSEEFVSGPGSWGVLEDSENLSLLRNIVKYGSQPLPEGFCTATDNRM
ncbi:hypothetical protein V5799_014372, partial [Amblyomma americanum]